MDGSRYRKQGQPARSQKDSSTRPQQQPKQGTLALPSTESKLKDLGHTVEGEADAKPIDEMKVDELKAYAAEHNIDLGEVKNKADILKTIQEAEAKE